jgi:hypothetical protein
MSGPWSSLEALPGQSALPFVWSRLLGEEYASFRNAFLEPKRTLACSIPCPLETGCWYWVNSNGSGLTGICKSKSASCPTMTLAAADVTPLKIDWRRLGRAVCQALQLTNRYGPMSLADTVQIGAWSGDCVPVLLTIQTERERLSAVICEIHARLRGKFILLTPTARHYDAALRELLNHVDAECFALESIVRLTENGTLQPSVIPGELFGRFNPRRRENAEEIARGIVEAVKRFESGSRMTKPTVTRVFELYCIAELSARQVAQKCQCTKSAVVRRLKKIKKVTGIKAEAMRRYSTHLEKMADRSGQDKPRNYRDFGI